MGVDALKQDLQQKTAVIFIQPTTNGPNVVQLRTVTNQETTTDSTNPVGSVSAAAQGVDSQGDGSRLLPEDEISTTHSGGGETNTSEPVKEPFVFSHCADKINSMGEMIRDVMKIEADKNIKVRTEDRKLYSSRKLLFSAIRRETRARELPDSATNYDIVVEELKELLTQENGTWADVRTLVSKKRAVSSLTDVEQLQSIIRERNEKNLQYNLKRKRTITE